MGGWTRDNSRDARRSLLSPQMRAFYDTPPAKGPFMQGGFITLPAVLSSATASATSPFTAIGSVNTNRTGGVLFWVVSTSGTPPTAAEILLGQDSSGNAAAASGNQAVPLIGTQSITAVGLASNTTLFAYFAQAISGLNSNIAAAASFITPIPALPAGALGVWYADQAVTVGGNAAVPNSLTAVPVSANQMRAPRRLFTDTTFWQDLTGGSITDSNVVGPDGLTQASTIVGVGGWAVRLRANASSFPIWPAGTYTIAINAKRAVGSNQQFRIRDALGAFTSGTFTATAAWQRFAFTFTLASPISMTIDIASFDGATGATIAICDFEMFSGSSDLGPEVLAGHMYLGATPTIAAPVLGGGYIDFTANNSYAIYQFLNPVSVTAVTVCALVNRTATGNASNRAVLAEAGTVGQTNFTMWDSFGTAGRDVGAIQFDNTVQAQVTGLWNQTGAGPHVITWRYDGTNLDVFFDDVVVNRLNSPGLSAQTIANQVVMLLEGTGGNGGDKLGALGIWPTALTNAQVYGVFDSWQQHFAPFYSMQLHKYYYFSDGDSITAFASSPISYAYLYGPLASQPVFGFNFAIAGSPLSGIIGTNLPVLENLLPPLSRQAGRNFILSVDIGTNDLNTVTGAVEAANLGNNYVDPLQALGWKVYSGTIIDRADVGGASPWATNANAFNTIIKGAWGHGSGIIDFAANANLGPPSGQGGGGPANNATNFQGDLVHPNQTGMNLIETIMKPVIDAAGP